MRLSTAKIFLFLSLFTALYSFGQVSHCDVPDSVDLSHRGVSAQIIRDYLLSHYLPEKDDFFLPDSLVSRAKNAMNAVWLNDSIQGWDSIYDLYKMHFLFGEAEKGYITKPSTYCADIFFDTSSSEFKALKESSISGDAIYDGLVSRYNIANGYWYDTITPQYPIRSAGFFNLEPLLDSLRLISWIDSVNVLSKYDFVGSRGGVDYIIDFVGDTTYIQYRYAYGDCQSGCVYRFYWNYRVLPDCYVDFLGHRKSTIPLPSVIFSTQVSCEDSMWIRQDIPFDDIHRSLTYVWINNLGSNNGLVYDPGTYSCLGLDPNGLLYRKWIYTVEFYDLSSLKISDTLLCSGDSYSLDSLDLPNYYLAKDNSIYAINEFNLSEKGEYTLNVLSCSVSDTFYVDLVEFSEIENEYMKCSSDSIEIEIDQNIDSVKWQDGFTGHSRDLSDQRIYKLTMFESGCLATDSISIRNFITSEFNIGEDTTAEIGVSITFEIPKYFYNVKWQDEDTSRLGSIRSNILGHGTHRFLVSAFDSFGCKYIDSFTINIDKPSSVVEAHTVLNIYPNPFSNKLHVKGQVPLFKYSIQTMQGLEILKGRVEENRIISNLDKISPGQYVLKLSQGSYEKHFRIMKL